MSAAICIARSLLSLQQLILIQSVTTKRKENAATSSTGVNFIRSLVEQHNCIFQKIDLENDVGNDAYIEFIKDQQATGCCIAAQIKSGDSYVSKDGSTFLLKADKPHFEYWASHSLPVCGVVFEPTTETAAWCDISEFLKQNPRVIVDGPYQIPIPRDRVLNANTYAHFAEHFLSYRNTYRSDQYFGEALERFAIREDVRGCQDALKSLFSFHRQRFSTWYYLLSCLRHFRGHPLLRPIIVRLCHIPGHGDIFWHKENIIDSEVTKAALAFMKQALGKEDVIALLESVDENGFSRGSIGQCVHSIIDVAERQVELLSSITFDQTIADETRFSALQLLACKMQQTSKDETLKLIRSYLEKFPNSEFGEQIKFMDSEITETGWIGFY